jgi:hypothetical protein
MVKSGKLPVAGFLLPFLNINDLPDQLGNYWSQRGVKKGILDLQF